MPLDLSEVALDPDLGQPFCIIRTSGNFGAGGWIANPECQIKAFGIIEIASPQALMQVPEGDRVQGSIQIIAAQRIFETSEDKGIVSDKVHYLGSLYRVQNVQPWKYNGYWSAILTRMKGS